MKVKQVIDAVKDQVDGRGLIGVSQTLEFVSIAYLSGGHILLEGPPGTGKTRMARLIAKLFSKSFKRIQFTSDLLPADIIGANIFSQKTHTFSFMQGPLFSDFVLSDEINRAPPRTQSALLEAMEERQVTVEGTCYPLSPDFFVMATQNPQDLEGTFPLPEAQMDRFQFQVMLQHGDEGVENEILTRHLDGSLVSVEQEVTALEINRAAIAQEIQGVTVDPSLVAYVTGILAGLRRHPLLDMGASVRGGIAILNAARILALVGERDFVIPDDIKKAALPALRHRVKQSAEAMVSHANSDQIILEVLEAKGVKS